MRGPVERQLPAHGLALEPDPDLERAPDLERVLEQAAHRQPVKRRARCAQVREAAAEANSNIRRPKKAR